MLRILRLYSNKQNIYNFKTLTLDISGSANPIALDIPEPINFERTRSATLFLASFGIGIHPANKPPANARPRSRALKPFPFIACFTASPFTDNTAPTNGPPIPPSAPPTNAPANPVIKIKINHFTWKYLKG